MMMSVKLAKKAPKAGVCRKPSRQEIDFVRVTVMVPEWALSEEN